MYKIEKKSFGFKLTFGGTIGKDEMIRWVDESQTALTGQSGKFGVLIDMRALGPLPAEAQGEMSRGQKLYKDKGMERSAVVVSSSTLAMQFKRLAKESGIYQWERYIDASSRTDWEKAAENWVTKALDPDKKEAVTA